MHASAGERVIVVYKAAKGAAELVAGVVLAAVVLLDSAHGVAAIAHALRNHAAGEWSIRVAALVTRRNVELGAVALVLDGVLSCVEGAALHTGRAWGRWLVVVATSLLVPFEVVSLAREPRVSHVLMLVVNLVIVAYLAVRTRRDQLRRSRAKASHRSVSSVGFESATR